MTGQNLQEENIALLGVAIYYQNQNQVSAGDKPFGSVITLYHNHIISSKITTVEWSIRFTFKIQKIVFIMWNIY